MSKYRDNFVETLIISVSKYTRFGTSAKREEKLVAGMKFEIGASRFTSSPLNPRSWNTAGASAFTLDEEEIACLSQSQGKLANVDRFFRLALLHRHFLQFQSFLGFLDQFCYVPFPTHFYVTPPTTTSVYR